MHETIRAAFSALLALLAVLATLTKAYADHAVA
jgi:hypothetical protein